MAKLHFLFIYCIINSIGEHRKMKAKEVMKILQITRPTLCKYVKQGLIKIDSCINGQYRYNAESVYQLVGNKK